MPSWTRSFGVHGTLTLVLALACSPEPGPDGDGGDSSSGGRASGGAESNSGGAESSSGGAESESGGTTSGDGGTESGGEPGTGGAMAGASGGGAPAAGGHGNHTGGHHHHMAGAGGQQPVSPESHFAELRVEGQCARACLVAREEDADAEGWAMEEGEPCLVPTSDLALASPSCAAPVPAPKAVVTDDTWEVAVLPRPAFVEPAEATNCPDEDTDFDVFEADWLVDGALVIPPLTKVLWQGNALFPAEQLFDSILVSEGSELVFADTPTTVRVQDFVVEGMLRVGSASCPFQSKLEIVFDTDEDVGEPAVREALAENASLGLVVEEAGAAEIIGRRHQPTWTRLAATAEADDTSLVVAEDVDWEPGDRIVVVTSAAEDYPLANENEVRTVTEIEDQRTIHLDEPLDYLHYGGDEYQVEVGLLSHDISLTTAERVSQAAPTFGGHVMAQHGGELRMAGVELRRLGQQNFIGRYPFHLHHLGHVDGMSFLTDSSIWESNWRCAVLHRTDRAIVSRNVAFDVAGHCFYLEDGVERGNELSFNLAARPKILGPTDGTSIALLNSPAQDGFTLLASEEMAVPADRAAAGFYLTNGHNQVFGNATSGGFTGYSLPNLPSDLGGGSMVPLDYEAVHFDGNTAHSGGYLWRYMGCVYAGGVIQSVLDQGVEKLSYTSGRTHGDLLRTGRDRFTNTKTFACEGGVTHWGGASELVNFESIDSGLSASLFGTASIDSAVLIGETGHTANLERPLKTFHRGFQFYDTWTLTALRDVIFRDFHDRPDKWSAKSGNDCALFGMTHSDQYTPQRMSATEGFRFVDVDAHLRLCVDAAGTLSARNFNFVDTDGSASGVAGDGVPPGPRLVGSIYSDLWKTSPSCVEHPEWGVYSCPMPSPHSVAAVSVWPNQSVTVTGYELTSGARIGENHYASTGYEEAQIAAPSGIGWHHAFPSGVPDSFGVWALQVPEASFVVLSFSVPPGVECSVPEPGWAEATSLDDVFTGEAPVYATDRGTCYVRIPETDAGAFVAAGQTLPRQLWKEQSDASWFTVITGCSSGVPTCATQVSTLPTLP